MYNNKTLTVTEILFGFRGRIGRVAFIGYNALIGLLLIALFFIAFSMMERIAVSTQLSGVALLYAPWLLALWPSAALLAKRLHDLNRSALHGIWITGLWYASPLLPDPLPTVLALIGLVAVFWLILMPGAAGPNRYGHKAGMARMSEPLTSPKIA